MNDDLTPYRTEREKDDLTVLLIVVFLVVGGLVRFTTGYITAALFAGLAAGRAVLLIADQVAMRRGAEVVTTAEASKREAHERASRSMWSVYVQAALSYGSFIIVLNLLAMQERHLAALPFVLVAAPLFGGVIGIFLALKARWDVGRMGSAK